LKDSYLTAGIKLDQLFRLLKRNNVSFNARTLLRILFLIQSAGWSSFFAIIEKLRYGKKLTKFPYPEDPIFIIGHWRTGSTFLHQLMSLDPNLAAPTLFQVAVPDSFLVSYPYYKPIFKKVVSKHRPMDQVIIGMDEPQEDEYAIFRMTNFSPLESLVFPKSQSYFLNHGNPFVPSGTEIFKWKSDVKHFYKKLAFRSKKRIISKNPFNSFRICLLHELFPKARFINIVRHPESVIPSTIHMWKILAKQNSLNDKGSDPEFKEVVGFLKVLMDKIEEDRKSLPPGTITDIRFEDLEQNPVKIIKMIYQDLHLPFSETLNDRIRNFMEQNKSFSKNIFTLSDNERDYISQELGNHMVDWKYMPGSVN